MASNNLGYVSVPLNSLTPQADVQFNSVSANPVRVGSLVDAERWEFSCEEKDGQLQLRTQPSNQLCMVADSDGSAGFSGLLCGAGATGDMLVGSGGAMAKRTIGSVGQVLTVAGGTATWATPTAFPSLPLLYSSGGVMSGAGFGTVWSSGAQALVAAENQNTRHVIMSAGNITKFGYSTVAADSTTQWKITINGVAQTFINGVAGTNGVINVGPFAVAAGNLVCIGYNAVGTVPSNSVMTVFVTSP